MTPNRFAATATVIGCLVTTACVSTADLGQAEADPITVFGPYQGDAADRFVASLAAFTDSTGIAVRYTGTADFVADLLSRTGDGNNPPDVAMAPQPGLVRQLADDGHIKPLTAETLAALDENFGDETRELGEIDGVPYGVPFRATIKSLVWFRPDMFAENGWEVPESLDDLELLAEQIEANTDLPPWCFTMASGTATGWVATDWIEDLVLRQAGEDAYREWSVGDIPFLSPIIQRSFDDFRALVLAPGRLDGGVALAIDTPVNAVLNPLLGDEPGCAMAKQADFALGWIPGGTPIGPEGDLDWFVLPGTDDTGQPPPLVVGGDLAVQFSDDPGVDQLLTFLAGPEAGAEWARSGGFLSPKSSFDPADYPSDAERELSSLLHGATTLVFDASDVMPVSIGSGQLWTDITSWVAGSISYDQFATGIDDAFESVTETVTQLPEDG